MIKDNNIMEWSREVVNHIMRKNDSSKYLYSIRLTFEPNPLNFDGMDDVKIEIMEKKNGSFFLGTEKVYYTNKDYCFGLEEAMADIDKWLATGSQ